MAPPQPSVTGRAILALALAAVFYALTAGVVFVLLRVVYAGFSGEARIPMKVAALCLAGAGFLIYSSLPRRARFVPPGPELRRTDQPAIWAMLEDLARETGQLVPTAAYWCPEPNAFVTSVGGSLGRGRRRVIGLGYPLAVTLDVDALRAVLAHEFGHFYAGDVKLGPLIYGTQAAVLRSTRLLGAVGERSIFFHMLHLPFLGFAKLFLRITKAVSRRQEYSADALAARLVAPGALGRALQALPRLERAWREYLEASVEPVVAAKRMPPIGAGFKTYLASPDVLATFARTEKRSSRRPMSGGPYDSHPPIADRLAALGVSAGSTPETADGSSRPSSIDVRCMDAVDAALVESITGNALVRGFGRIGWDRIVPEILEPRWRAVLTTYSPGIRGLCTERLPARAEDLTELGRRLNPKDAKDPAGAQQRAASVLTAALAVALRRHDFTLESRPGAPLRAHRGGETVDVEDVVRGVAAGRITSVTWADRCRALGIEGLDLGAESQAFLDGPNRSRA